MADLRIVDAPEIPTNSITGREKIPTGGSGNYSITLDSLADYTKTKKDLVDTTTVDTKVNDVRQELNIHIEDLLNPHQVTKSQIGLGNVDNTADLDKPVSNSTQAAITNTVAPKADKSYVDSSLLTKADKTYTDSQLALKADKTYVDSQDSSLQSQINQKATAEYLDNALSEQTQAVNTALSNLSTVASKFYPTLAKANADIANIAVNQPVQVGEVANGGLWYKATAEATALTKSPYDPYVATKAYADSLKLLSDVEDANTNDRVTRLLASIYALISVMGASRIEFDNFSSSSSVSILDLKETLAKLHTSLQTAISTLASNKVETDEFIGVNTKNISTLSDIQQRQHVALQATQEVLALVAENVTVENEEQKLTRLFMTHNIVLGLAQLDGFNPDAAGTGGGGSEAIVVEDIVVFKKPNSLIHINVYTDEALPTVKDVVINNDITINVEGSSYTFKGTMEVQGSSSSVLPKKNWTFGFFTDDTREDSIKVKLGHLMPHDELVFKSNFVDNIHSRNLGVNRLWEQMINSRSGFPKHEVDQVNMINSDLTVENFDGLKYAPTGALGHVDGFPAVIYINNYFYGIGSLNIGKKRDNYNLKKDNQKHIQFEPGGGINLNNMPVDPTDGSFDLRRPATWGSGAQASYDRLSAFFKLSVADMTTAGIDNYFNRAQMLDYIILLQVCDLFDHLHKNTMFTTWDGQIWSLLPYDLDNCFGLYFTGQYFNPSTGVAYRPPINLPIPPLGQVPDSSWGVMSRIRAVYGTDVDTRYKVLRNNGIISTDNVLNIFSELLRTYPKELLDAEDAKWNTGVNNLQVSLLQTGSLYQVNKWLTERLVRTDIYFNYST